jgi:uncharacterized membrane protein YgcG
MMELAFVDLCLNIIHRYIFMRLTFFFFLSLLSFNAFANDDFVIRSFDIEIEVLDDGSFKIQEKINVFFHEERRGIFRDIPIRYRINGKRTKIEIENVTVEDAKFRARREGSSLNIRIGNPKIYVKGAKEYVISYSVNNPLIWHDDFLEFYWNLIGDGWEVPIESVSFEVQFPEDVNLQKESINVFSGTYGAVNNEIEWDVRGRSIIGNSTKTLKPSEAITLATQLSKNDFSIPEPLPSDFSSRFNRLIKRDKLFALPLVLLCFLLSWFKQRGRRKNEETPLQFYPPENFTAAEVGYFYDHRLHDRDLMALIPKWGNEGLISMEVLAGDSKEPKIYFHKLGELDAGVPTYEKSFFNGLFESGNVVFLEDLKGSFHKVFSKSKSEFSMLNAIENLYDQESKATFHNSWYHLIWAALIGLGIFCMIKTYFLTGIGLFALALVGFIITLLRPRLSDRGFMIHNHLKGLKVFLENPDDTELMQVIRENPDYLNQIFPYVVAFGLDRSWEERIKNMRQSDPEWYYGSGIDNSAKQNIGFSDGFNLRSITSAFAEAPASTGSNGTGGGGFSGGGMGGGGGGSW